MLEQQALVVGPGRVGRAIAAAHVPPARLVGRGRGELPLTAQHEPIWVTTTNAALDDVLARTAPQQRADLVFTQNGFLLPWLRQHQLQHNTQVLLYMSAADDGSVTDGGGTCACGRHAARCAEVLAAMHVRCEVLSDWHAFHGEMLIKLLWSCIAWPLSAALGLPVGDVAQRHAADVRALVDELLPIALGCVNSGGHQPALVLDAEDVTQRVLAYSRAIAPAVPSVAMARAEAAWRNGVFLRQRATPGHAAWLQRAGCSDLVAAFARPADGGGG